jgi:hypothetical protein
MNGSANFEISNRLNNALHCPSGWNVTLYRVSDYPERVIRISHHPFSYEINDRDLWQENVLLILRGACKLCGHHGK